jgi:hypothetical protein
VTHLDLIHCTRRVLAVVGAVVLLAVVAAPLARADGDPASDVLASQALFVPQDAGLSAGQQAQLDGLLAAGRRSGYDLHVAVIASSADLGSVGALWRAPAKYARFLGLEISLAVHGPLLVVMPDGYGYVRAAGAAGSDPSIVGGLPTPGRALAQGTLAAVRHVAQAAGHPLPQVALGSPTASRGSSPGLAWGVFAGGWLVVAAAWVASLRARPLRWRHGVSG